MRFLSVLTPFLAALLCTANLYAEDPLQNERFGIVGIQRGESSGGPVAVFFTGEESDSKATLEALAPVTSLTITVDSARYRAGIEKQDKDQSCSYLAGEVERLGQSIQNSQSLSYYKLPWLVGAGEGASIAYAVYAEHPKAFAGVVTWGACGQFTFGVPLCKGDMIDPRYDKASSLVQFELHRNLPGRNFALHSWVNGCQNQGALPEREAWRSHLKDFFESEAETAAPPEVAGLPLIELPARKDSASSPASSTLVVFLSGDGGWATIDKEIGQYLSKAGVSVVGFDCLRYFWSHKTPEETAHAIVRVIAKYRKIWHKDKAVLVGFSLGAEHIPYVLNRLPEISRPVVPLAILLSPGKGTDFEVHISDWLGLEPTNGEYMVAPELAKVTQSKIACVYGEDEESDSACIDLPSGFADVQKLPGGHHFNGDYKKVGEMILNWMHEEGL